MVALPPSLAIGAVGFVVAVVGAPSGAAVLDASHPAGTAGPADPATFGMQAGPTLSQVPIVPSKAGVLIFSKTVASGTTASRPASPP